MKLSASNYKKVRPPFWYKRENPHILLNICSTQQTAFVRVHTRVLESPSKCFERERERVHEDTYVDIRGRGKRVYGLLIKVAENLPAYLPSPTLSPARSLPFSRAALPLPPLPSSPSLPFPQITFSFLFFPHRVSRAVFKSQEGELSC